MPQKDGFRVRFSIKTELRLLPSCMPNVAIILSSLSLTLATQCIRTKNGPG